MKTYSFYKDKAEQLFIFTCLYPLCPDVQIMPFIRSTDIEWSHKEYLDEILSLCFDVVYFDHEDDGRFCYYIPELPKQVVPSPSVYFMGQVDANGFEITGTVWQPLLIAYYVLHCYKEE